jgi:hypothetical protein
MRAIARAVTFRWYRQHLLQPSKIVEHAVCLQAAAQEMLHAETLLLRPTGLFLGWT